jgi:response regulator RpfG family c-di-GMP phosphodiesterase
MKSLSGSTFDPEILDAFFNIQTVEIKEGRKRAKDCFLMTAQRGF